MTAARAILLVFLAMPWPAASRGAEITPELALKITEVLQRAGGQHRKQEYLKAIESYREALGLIPAGAPYNPMRLKVHFSIATGFVRLDRADEALDHLEKAVDNGFADASDLERRPDFATLRGSPRYTALLENLRNRVEEERRRQAAEKRRRADGLKSFDFSLRSVDGKTISKKDYQGQVLIVDIWGTWCPPCRMEIPHFLELERRYGAQGLRIVGLNSEKIRDPEQAERVVRETMKSLKITYPCAMATDPVLRSIPNLRAYPTTLFFGRDGTPRAFEEGYKDLAALEAIVKPLLAEPTPATEAKK